jgi:hypothetical protein
MGISDATWEDWAPLICDEGDPYCTAAPDLNLICQPQDVRSSTSYCNFLTRITKSKESPPLLAFAAALTLARIEGLSRILFFDPYRSDVSFDGCDPPYTLCPSFRAGLFNALKEINISFAEIARVAEGFGLKMYDCGALTFDQYSKLRWGRQSRKFALREDVTEEEWRAIFGTPLPKD